MKKFFVTCMAMCTAFCFCACGGKGGDSSSVVLGEPLTAEDEQKIEVVVGQIDYVLDAMPDLDDLMGSMVNAVATGDLDTLRSMQNALAPMAEAEEDKSVTFSFGLDLNMDISGVKEDMIMAGFFKITEEAVYAEYTDVAISTKMSMNFNGESMNLSTLISMPFKLYIDAEEVYLYYDAFDVTVMSNGETDTISLGETEYTGRWIDLNDGYFSAELAEYFEQTYQSIAGGMRSSLKTMKSFFEDEVASKMTNVDGVYTLKADLMDEYYRAYASEAGDSMQIVDASLYNITGDITIDVSNPAKTAVKEKVSVEMNLAGLSPELADLLGAASYTVNMVNGYSFYDINTTTIEKPTEVGPWELDD